MGHEVRAPHVNLIILFSGIMRALHTVLFFEGESSNDEDAVLSAVPRERRERLIARREDASRYRFDIRLRGEDETVFFEA
jgi:protocatechuate 3,4-dioxygenase alpha subunit